MQGRDTIYNIQRTLKCIIGLNNSKTRGEKRKEKKKKIFNQSTHHAVTLCFYFTCIYVTTFVVFKIIKFSGSEKQ